MHSGERIDVPSCVYPTLHSVFLEKAPDKVVNNDKLINVILIVLPLTVGIVCIK